MAKDPPAKAARVTARKKAGVERQRCGKPLGDGRNCIAWAVEGHDRCRRHGGTPAEKASTLVRDTVVTGGSAPAFRNLRREGLVRIAQLHADPDLLSIRAPVVKSTFLTEQLGVDPSQEDIRDLAMQITGKQFTEELTPADLLDARNRIIERVHKVIAANANVIYAANKALKVNEMITQAAMPLLAKFGERIKRVAAKHMRDPAVYEAFMNDLRDQVAVLVGELGHVGDSVDP